MPELVASMLAFILCYLAFALLALCQAPHRKTVDPLASAPSPVGQLARMVVAAACLATALFVLLAAQGNGFATLLWALLISASAMVLSLTLSWKPGWLRLLSKAFGG